MTIDHYLIGRLAEVMFVLADSPQERVALGCMYRNRVNESLSWADVVSWFVDDNHNYPANPHDPAFIQCLWDAESIYYNRQADLTGGADTFTITPLALATKVGRFYFFKRGLTQTIIVSTPLPSTVELAVYEPPIDS